MPNPGPTPAPSPSRILVADDEYLVAMELTAWLTARGYTPVGPAGSGAEAVRLARETRPDMALLDIRMPDGDGLSAAATLISELGIPVVMITAYTERGYVKLAEEAGVFGYLVKPAESAQLAAAIDAAWARYRESVGAR